MSHDSYFKSKPIVEDYKPATILVFRNGDEYDSGTKVTVTRNRFPHWLHLLDYLTTKLQPNEGPVHHLYDLYQNELLHFKELENDGVYVAANKKFKQVRYNSKRHFGTTKKPFDSTNGLPLSSNRDPKSIHSKESYEIYLKNRNFKPATVRDMWNDDPGKRTKFVSTRNESVYRTDSVDRSSGQKNQVHKFPYHLYDSTKLRPKNQLEPVHSQTRSHSEPRSKVAQVGAGSMRQHNSIGAQPKYARTFTYTSPPKNVQQSQFPIKINKERNHQMGSGYDLNGHKIVEHSNHLGAQTRHSKSASGLRVHHGSLQGHTLRSSMSDSNIERNSVQHEHAGAEPYLEVYKYYGKSSQVDREIAPAEWDSDSGHEKKVSTQAVKLKERATNTTASYLNRRYYGSKQFQPQKNIIPPKTATATIPRWAQQLQSAVNDLSNKVDLLSNVE